MEELPYNHAGYPEDPGADGRTDQAGAASEEDISRACGRKGRNQQSHIVFCGKRFTLCFYWRLCGSSSCTEWNGPGSYLGGARLKATVQAPDGAL